MNLPLLEHVVDSFEYIDLNGCSIVGAQHLLGTTFDLFKCLFKKGLKPERTFLIGKCYSSSSMVGREMKRSGIYVSPHSFEFSSHKPFDQQYAASMKEFLKSVLPRAVDSEKIIFLDDGGGLIKLAHKMLDNFEPVFGVEQTTSGYEALRNFCLKFPVINVARSPAKLIYESPMIAEVVAKHVHKSLKTIELSGKKALILGGGAIGKSIYERVKYDFDVKIFDTNQGLSMIKATDFCNYISASDLIIGCTGRSTLRRKHYKLLKKGVVLASASSSDREFEAFYFRKNIDPISDPHSDIHFNGVNLLNGGFPINFDGRRHSVPANLIQLTRALLVCGVMQGLSDETLSTEMVPLDLELQREVVSKFFEFCGTDYRKIVKNPSYDMLIQDKIPQLAYA